MAEGVEFGSRTLLPNRSAPAAERASVAAPPRETFFLSGGDKLAVSHQGLLMENGKLRYLRWTISRSRTGLYGATMPYSSSVSLHGDEWLIRKKAPSTGHVSLKADVQPRSPGAVCSEAHIGPLCSFHGKLG